jgi:thiamine kinase-like enzyme
MFQVPLHKEPGWLWDTIDRWLKTCEAKLKGGDVPEFLRDVVNGDIVSEVDWLKKRLEMENCAVVFCHNDMQEGNILIRQDDPENNNNDDPQIVVIGKISRWEIPNRGLPRKSHAIVIKFESYPTRFR